jgi:sugar O-acyltransferase (sialic acid O-acetyltransferase NeuD family)
MDNIILVGSSGHAKVVIDIVEQQGQYKIVGLLDAFRKIGEETLGYSILGAESDLPKLIESHNLKGALIAIGDNFIRAKVAEKIAIIAPNLPFVSAIHPNASIGRGTTIGAGSVVMAGCAVNPCCSVGNFVILNTNASLDHDSCMENYSSLAPRASTGGSCRIGAYSAISIGATIRHGIAIGEHTVVGAGSVVLKNLEANCIAYGIPAKKIRSRQLGEKYL